MMKCPECSSDDIVFVRDIRETEAYQASDYRNGIVYVLDCTFTEETAEDDAYFACEHCGHEWEEDNYRGFEVGT